MVYKVAVRETWVSLVDIEADCEREAYDKALDMYNFGKIVPTEDAVDDVEYDIISVG